MKWINTTDIENWGRSFDSKGVFPLLIARLIRATSTKISNLWFPGGKNIFVGGWDGIVESSEATEFIPRGISLWELGTEDDHKGKADKEYAKRTADSLGYLKTDATFVFITPHFWKDKEIWRSDKLKDGVWKEIKIYDARDIEMWIDNAPAVGRWFGIRIHKYPPDGIQPTEHFWEEWSIGPKGQLPPCIITDGREFQMDQLREFLNNVPAIKAVKATSKEEAIAFIVGCAQLFEQQIKENFFSKSLIIDTTAVFRSITSNQQSLILIPRFEDIQILYNGVYHGHHIILPLGADDTFNSENIIVLPQIGSDGIINSLKAIKFSEEDARKYSRESGKNITILKRLLKYPQNKIEWSKAENARDIIPAMLIGRWDESKEHDQNILSKLAGESYATYIAKLSKWKKVADPPIFQIGTTWRLSSPLDAWVNLSSYLTNADFDKLKDCFLEVLNEIDPAFDLEPEKRYMASMYTKNRQFSEWIREGMIQSLILTSIFGDKLQYNLPLKAELWVDRIIYELLNKNNPLFWKSIQGKLPLIAEASPVQFLNAVEKNLAINKSPIVELFQEDPNPITPHSYHTGLLWALEGVAWLPEYLSRASSILAHLSAIDPGGRLSNRPINSLTEIFKPWYYQTLSPFDERMEVLKLIAKKEKEVAWKLLIRMLPDPLGSSAHPTHKMRWRMFNETTKKPITHHEIWNTHSAVVDMLIDNFDYSESRFANLIEESINLINIKDRNKLFEFLESAVNKINQINYSAWHSLRILLSDNRSNPDAKWALKEDELVKYEKLFKVLSPSDEIKKSIWMFDEHWPKFPDGFERKKINWEEQQKIIDKRRLEALREIYIKYGIEKIKELSTEVKEQRAIGDSLAFLITTESEIISVCELLNSEEKKLPFIHSFIFRKSLINGIDWIFQLYDELKKKFFNDSALSELFIPLNPSKKLWDFINLTNDKIKQEYWKNVYPRFYHVSTEEKITGIKYLIEFKRFFSAIVLCSHYAKEIPTELLIEILEKSAIEKANEEVRLDGYELTSLFEELDERVDADKKTLIKLEWYFLPVLSSYGSNRNPKLLHEELSSNHEFFVDVLKWIYKPGKKKVIKTVNINLSPEQIKNRAEQAFKLLHSWKKIPGINDKGDIDNMILLTWIEKVRELADEYGLLETADAHIGQVLAEYPETKDKIWPPDPICSVLEKINTDSIKRNFSSATHNKRSFSSRSPFDGGDRERGIAKYFKELSEKQKNKFPIVAALLEGLSKSYEQDAIREDERAERDILEY